MKRTLFRVIPAAFSIMILATACSKDDTTTNDQPVEAKTAANLNGDPASTANHYAFFSLENNAVVPYTDSATNKWDIAVRSTTILINGGTSGPAGGGAFVQNGTTFADYKQIPADSVFKVDNIASTPAFAIPTGSGNGWYSYNPATNIIAPIPGRLLVIRTATGKYAKVEITSYYKDAPATPDATTSLARYYTLRFSFQPNGSKKF